MFDDMGRLTMTSEHTENFNIPR